jgi:hypothetical protein
MNALIASPLSYSFLSVIALTMSHPIAPIPTAISPTPVVIAIPENAATPSVTPSRQEIAKNNIAFSDLSITQA